MAEKSGPSVKFLGLLQALGVTLYCSMIGLIFSNGEVIFGNVPNYAGPVAALLLLSTSVLICGLLVFYKPYRLFFENNLPAGRQGKREAIDLVLYTTAWLFLFFITFLTFAASHNYRL
ncbi:hypothetical protein A3A76_04720 [Candidatus Woesebacteria bacterium RIFCSPLOWO2_01_FULL_39_23]|uniref:Uncharacterized protein n=2 Tax=Microgenomates group TaxID=1794810 RepID=A0A0H4T669_9BACT|nr:Uncharacterized protein [uncultured Microgenomates bacterium Rifle_16ft_4_minimus_37633]OGM13787.1 MAG: hypothetical protein A2141_03945 [Candidatus Woesebacteria bacterium RBG_16_40_11]OGM27737.1 MAG: hypothetical protein A2628_04940 [Candidatus Woesebacteria bacterium RIFCSPHIGHO2_01_FULL_40_22]OGM36003.1 MAG: hypothetical protein A3E41_01195 [Candidatus Woesebacteria bacterium RIFCSPHIGHO2_12_FULL_38_9]OGM62159.1 MAG: hypothetical protein A3A76_04720 [Candidatus Woesebacteria bacterium RI